MTKLPPKYLSIETEYIKSLNKKKLKKYRKLNLEEKLKILKHFQRRTQNYTGYTPAEKLLKYKELLVLGSITQEQYESKKKKILKL